MSVGCSTSAALNCSLFVTAYLLFNHDIVVIAALNHWIINQRYTVDARCPVPYAVVVPPVGVLLRNDFRQIVNTLVPLSPSIGSNNGPMLNAIIC